MKKTVVFRRANKKKQQTMRLYLVHQNYNEEK